MQNRRMNSPINWSIQLHSLKRGARGHASGYAIPRITTNDQEIIMSKKSNVKVSKVTKNSRVEKAEKPAKKAVKAAGNMGDLALSRVYKPAKPFKKEKGVLVDFISAIPAKGAPLSVIAKKADIEIKKARAYAYFLTSKGFLNRLEA